MPARKKIYTCSRRSHRSSTTSTRRRFGKDRNAFDNAFITASLSASPRHSAYSVLAPLVRVNRNRREIRRNNRCERFERMDSDSDNDSDNDNDNDNDDDDNDDDDDDGVTCWH